MTIKLKRPLFHTKMTVIRYQNDHYFYNCKQRSFWTYKRNRYVISYPFLRHQKIKIGILMYMWIFWPKFIDRGWSRKFMTITGFYQNDGYHPKWPLFVPKWPLSQKSEITVIFESKILTQKLTKIIDLTWKRFSKLIDLKSMEQNQNFLKLEIQWK